MYNRLDLCIKELKLQQSISDRTAEYQPRVYNRLECQPGVDIRCHISGKIRQTQEFTETRDKFFSQILKSGKSENKAGLGSL